MKKQYFLPLLIIWLLVAAALTSHCSKGSSYDSSMTNTGTGNNKTVAMQNDRYSPGSLTVAKGTTVTWNNNDYTTHTVTADDNSFNSGDITAGRSFTKTFNETGTFPYHCTYHSMMKGTIIVN